LFLKRTTYHSFQTCTSPKVLVFDSFVFISSYHPASFGCFHYSDFTNHFFIHPNFNIRNQKHC
jgi:hypothetical protein